MIWFSALSWFEAVSNFLPDVEECIETQFASGHSAFRGPRCCPGAWVFFSPFLMLWDDSDDNSPRPAVRTCLQKLSDLAVYTAQWRTGVSVWTFETCPNVLRYVLAQKHPKDAKEFIMRPETLVSYLLDSSGISVILRGVVVAERLPYSPDCAERLNGDLRSLWPPWIPVFSHAQWHSGLTFSIVS